MTDPHFSSPAPSKAELAAWLNTHPRNPFVGVLYRLSGLHLQSKLHRSMPKGLSPAEYVAQLLEQLNLHSAWLTGSAERIPQEGPLLVVANHPFGVVDALVLLDQILPHRSDVRLLIEPDQIHFDQLAPLLVRSLDEATACLLSGGCVLTFPAGSVSRFSRDLRTVADGRWSNDAVQLQQASGAPVLPVHIGGQGVDLMKLFEAVHPDLRRLPVLHKPPRSSQRALLLRTGSPLHPKDLAAFDHPDQITRFFRAKTYALATQSRVSKSWFERSLKRAEVSEDVVEREPLELLERDLAHLPEQALLFEQSGFRCYLAEADQIPNVLKELGRLREVTFRAVGEGTGHGLDLDEFDLHYHHLFLWHIEGQEIAGAYRIGFGNQIMERYGKRGFYTSTLFRFQKPFLSVLEQAIELGRSFVPLAYQKHRMPLFLLWKGVLSQLVTHPECRYVIGPVTISNQYNPLSKLLMMHYVHEHGSHDELDGLVTPRKPYRPRVVNGRKQDVEALLASVGEDMRRLDRLVADIEPDGATVPVLLKRYLAQNARILAFNHDPKFNDALDGFMVLDLNDLPSETVANLQREFA